jgi:hypothetical protein
MRNNDYVRSELTDYEFLNQWLFSPFNAGLVIQACYLTPYPSEEIENEIRMELFLKEKKALDNRHSFMRLDFEAWSSDCLSTNASLYPLERVCGSKDQKRH